MEFAQQGPFKVRSSVARLDVSPNVHANVDMNIMQMYGYYGYVLTTVPPAQDVFNLQCKPIFWVVVDYSFSEKKITQSTLSFVSRKKTQKLSSKELLPAHQTQFNGTLIRKHIFSGCDFSNRQNVRLTAPDWRAFAAARQTEIQRSGKSGGLNDPPPITGEGCLVTANTNNCTVSCTGR